MVKRALIPQSRAVRVSERSIYSAAYCFGSVLEAKRVCVLFEILHIDLILYIRGIGPLLYSNYFAINRRCYHIKRI